MKDKKRRCKTMQKRFPNTLELAVLRKIDLSIVLKTLTIFAATLVLFSQDLIIIFNDALRSDTTSHILVVPILFSYLVYRKRKMLKAVISYPTTNQSIQFKIAISFSGILLCLTSVLLYWYGSYTFIPLEYHILAMPIFIAGLILIIFNTQTLRQLAFSISFLIFLAPPNRSSLWFRVYPFHREL